jgi:hypothetical protein
MCASVSDKCCKSRLRCYICCNGCTRMLQASVPNVSSMFSDVCCKCVYPDVVYISHICCKVFCLNVAYVLQWFHVFLDVFASVSYACFKCFIRLHTYIVNVASRCFKSRSDVASPSLPSAPSPWCILLAFSCLASFSDRGWRRGREHMPSPSLLRRQE